MDLGHHVESFRFWDVVAQWSRETLQHELIVARALAKGVIRDGLRLQSVDAAWAKPGTFELRGAPLVGFVARPGSLPVFIRASALRHLTDVVEKATTPEPLLLYEEFITRQDFRAWLAQTGLRAPSFWFAAGD
jgi:hypothetical protein